MNYKKIIISIFAFAACLPLHAIALFDTHVLSQPELDDLLRRHGESAAQRIFAGYNNIAPLADETALTPRQLFDIVKFIETDLKGKTKNGRAYLRKEKTGLARTLEYANGRTFIHLKTHGVELIGQGNHKRVTRSLMYANGGSTFVANCVGDNSVQHEGKILQRLKGLDGIAETYAVNSHKKKSGKLVHSIMMKHYNGRTVRTYECSPELLTPLEKVKIARDLMKGLENVHSKKVAHRDLYSTNFYVSKDGSDISTVLADFGEATSFDKAKKMVPRVEVPSRFICPESLVKEKHRVDVRKIEAYAVGCSLYALYFGATPTWCEELTLNRKIRKYSKNQKKKLKQKLTRKIREDIKRKKAKILKSPGPYKEFGEVILKLIDPNPKLRFAPHAARTRCEEIIKKMITIEVPSSS